MKVRIALLPKPEQSNTFIEYSQAIPVAGEGYRLDLNHLPHITIVAWEVAGLFEAEVVWKKMDDIYLPEVHCKIHDIDYTGEGSNAGYVIAHVDSSDELQSFIKTIHESISDVVSDEDRSKYAARTPHLTIAVDTKGVPELPTAPFETIAFDRIALVKSGEYGAAGEVIHVQPLA